MSVKLRGLKRRYNPKDSDEVRCDEHGVVTTWGDLDALQRLAVEEGIDTFGDQTCILAPLKTKLAQ